MATATNGVCEPAEAMRDALNEAALLLGEPKLHGARRRRKRAGFTQAEYEAYHEEREQTAGPGGHRRHE